MIKRYIVILSAAPIDLHSSRRVELREYTENEFNANALTLDEIEAKGYLRDYGYWSWEVIAEVIRVRSKRA